MRILHCLLMVLFSAMLFQCREDSEQIQPKIPTKDTASAVSSSLKNDSAFQDSVINPLSESPKANKKSSLDFTKDDYQHGKYQAMPYRVLTPHAYDSTKEYPLVIFLHGIDERGIDNDKQLLWGSKEFQSPSVRNRFPSFVIFPQCPIEYRWADPQTMQTLRALIDDFIAHNNVNVKKMYVVGMSMGAYGTYELVARNPGFFAAAIAISGDGDVNRVAGMAKTQWKIYAGAKDNIVTSDKSERMAKALANSGAKVSIKVYPNANHVGSWVNAFKEPDFFSWLYSVSK